MRASKTSRSLKHPAAARSAIAIGLLLAGCSSIRPSQQRVVIYAAPAVHPEGGVAWAEVLHWAGESAICVLRRRPDSGEEELLFKAGFFSSDAAHGFRISAASWSPDGRYLAYQLYSSGGHQPYRAPVNIIDGSSLEETDLADQLDAQHGDGSWCPTGDGTDFHWSADGSLHFDAVRWDQGFEFTRFSYDPGTRKLAMVRDAP